MLKLYAVFFAFFVIQLVPTRPGALLGPLTRRVRRAYARQRLDRTVLMAGAFERL